MAIWKNKIGKVVAFSVFASVISVAPIAAAENYTPPELKHNLSTQANESLLPSEQDIQDIRDEMTSRGISNEDQEAIVEKFAKENCLMQTILMWNLFRYLNPQKITKSKC